MVREAAHLLISVTGDWFRMGLIVRSSEVHAAGVFTTAPIKRRSKVVRYTGPIISKEEGDRIYENSPVTYLFGLDDGRTVIDGHGTAMFINHSCDPNVILDMDNMVMIACRDIKAGDELTFFYPSTEWEMDAPFICLCGASNCIHVVAGARFLPLSTLETHYLNRHIREMMIDLLNATQQHRDKLTSR